MSTIFLCEDGHGNNVVDENEFVLETFTTLSKYMQTVSLCESSLTSRMLIENLKDEDAHMNEANVKRDYMRYTVQDKARFFDLKIEKCMSASAAVKQLGIHIRTAHRWAKQYSICPKKNRSIMHLDQKS